MSSILDNPTVRKAALRLVPDQYHQLCRAGIIQENTELIDGIVVTKMGKSPLHTWTVEFLADWFRTRSQISCYLPTCLRRTRSEFTSADCASLHPPYSPFHPLDSPRPLSSANTFCTIVDTSAASARTAFGSIGHPPMG